MKKASWCILFLLMGVSCLDQPDCFRQNLNLVGVSFKKMFDGRADTVYIVKINSPDTEKSDYEWYDTTLVTSLSLPVNFFSKLNTTTFNIERNVDGQILQNILQVSYKSKTQFVSADCGERFLITDLALLKSVMDFDSVQLVSGDLSNPAHTNIVVYRCPKTNYVKLVFRQLFMDANLGQPDVRRLDSIITDYGLRIVFKNTGVSSVRLPLNEQGNITTFRFLFHDGTADTLTLNYTSQSKTLFTLCGPQQFHKLADTANIQTSFKKNLQVFRVVRDSLFDPPITNIQVTRCPQSNLINVLFKRISSLGGATFRDSVLLKSVTADYPAGNLLAGINGKVTNLTLPLNPNSAITATTFYFDIDSASTIKKDTLKLSYTVGNPVQYHAGCPAISPISALQIDNTTFNVQTRVADTNVKFPATSNIEIIQ